MHLHMYSLKIIKQKKSSFMHDKCQISVFLDMRRPEFVSV